MVNQCQSFQMMKRVFSMIYKKMSFPNRLVRHRAFWIDVLNISDRFKHDLHELLGFEMVHAATGLLVSILWDDWLKLGDGSCSSICYVKMDKTRAFV